jgi:alcohol dehydrogenase
MAGPGWLENVRAANFHGPRQTLAIAALPGPAPKQGKALVCIRRAAISGSDLLTLAGRRSAPVNCATVTVVAVLRRAPLQAGEAALVMGAGLLSLEAAMWLKQAGWGPAHVVDVDAQRARRALAYGADALRLPARAGLALDFKGAPEAMEAELNALRPGGVLPRAGALCPSRFLALAAEDVMRRMLRMEGIHN